MKRTLILIISLVLLLTSCGSKSIVKSESVDNIVINNKVVSIESGTNIEASEWNEKEYYFNDESLKRTPILFGGITIGSKIEDVLEIFDIKPGYAKINREIDTCGDGTTEIVEEEYISLEFFSKEKVLDAAISFAYILEDDKWTIVPFSDLETIYENNNAIIYNLDFVGGQLADDENLNEKELISFSVIRP